MDKFIIRLPQGMRERMHESAAAHLRSMNAEAIMALEWWLKKKALVDSLQSGMQEELNRLKAAAAGKPTAETLLPTFDMLAESYPETEVLIQSLKRALAKHGLC